MDTPDLIQLRKLLLAYTDGDAEAPVKASEVEQKIRDSFSIEELEKALTGTSTPSKSSASQSAGGGAKTPSKPKDTRAGRLEPERVRELRERYRAYAYSNESLVLTQAAREEGMNYQTFTKILTGESYADASTYGRPLSREEMEAAKSPTALKKRSLGSKATEQAAQEA